MLDIIRKRAQSWMTIAIFAVVIIVFVFFFGFDDVRRGSYGGGSGKGASVAQVGWIPITSGELQLAVENNTAFYKEQFKDEIPEAIYKGIRPATLQQLVNQKLFELYARKLGLRVSDEELAAKIRSLPYLQKDGVFDKAVYQSAFLPEIWRRYQVDFEYILKNELLVEKFNALLKDSVTVSPAEAQDSFAEEKTRWTFSITEVDPDALVSSKKIVEASEARRVAVELQAASGQAAVRDKILKTYGLTEKKVGPVPLSGRSRLFGPQATLEAYRAVFALSKPGRGTDTPINVGEKWFVVRLESMDEAGREEWKKEETQFAETLRKEKGETRLQWWLVKYSSRAKVRRYVNLEES